MKKSTVHLKPLDLSNGNSENSKPVRTRKIGLVQLIQPTPGLLAVSPTKKVNRKWSAPPCFRRKRYDRFLVSLEITFMGNTDMLFVQIRVWYKI